MTIHNHINVFRHATNCNECQLKLYTAFKQRLVEARKCSIKIKRLQTITKQIIQLASNKEISKDNRLDCYALLIISTYTCFRFERKYKYKIRRVMRIAKLLNLDEFMIF